MNLSETLSAEFIDAQYRQWKSDPNSLSEDWQFFFRGFEMAGTKGGSGDAGDPEQAMRQARVSALIHRYRDIGHLLACMDPLSACPTSHPLLDLDAFGLEPSDLERTFAAPGLMEAGSAPLKEIIGRLKQTYCHSIGVEYMHIQDPDERAWLQACMEPGGNRTAFSAEDRGDILRQLSAAALFEAFLNKKYVGVTRFSLEGGESLIPFLEALCRRAHEAGCREVILGMAHRGRLNVLRNILAKPADEIFSEFESCYDPHDLIGSGDVKYHNGYLAERRLGDGDPMTLYMVSNPSHLEAVDPVVTGIARARQDRLDDRPESVVMPVLLHGDAAFAGQGVVAETLNMSQLKGYRTGGSVHVIINNQIGYTTLPEDARSTRYSTDVAKGLMVPIFHVHGEDPEAVVHVARLAADYRYQFGKDVVVDLVCYRRYGHNEGDEPYFTQPTMYQRIRDRAPIHQVYGQQLVGEKIIAPEAIAQIDADINAGLDAAFESIHGTTCLFPEPRFFPEWEGISGTFRFNAVATAVAKKPLTALAERLAALPADFTVHPRLKGVLNKRLEAVLSGEGIDWAGAEALAFATLLAEGHPVRLSGQDVGRGTFSQRHSVLWDYQTGQPHMPLSHLAPDQAPFAVYNSLLAEAGVLGFEYGYAVTRPEVLTLWEAQFGDFANNAQGIIDLFIASGQAKWQQLCGLTLLLPHGWEGLGPEHSSARLERFLQLCAGDNLQVANLTTPAQYFHLLRRQVKAPFRKPLVIMTPKSLLRHPLAVSSLKALTSETFQPVIDDAEAGATAKKVVFCSGKLYYQLIARRQQIKALDTAIVRVEQLHPFPEKALKTVIGRYKKATVWIWAQEEPENMGAWQYMRPRLGVMLKKTLAYVGRNASASPATGFPKIYKMEQDGIVDRAIGPHGQSGEVAG
ncbi:2-oxoglutarate decarboxylase, thiamin-requiring [Desulfosarcina cetonica]|uniref:2-oxoglutarate dehydrogenase E1 component n=1 Tax=Desulfosarcina cetonica TaxID=90730 RepID=UPI0006D00ED7|nr:2-oxoglutarate dehydrogenase E1 component [Desulfosarcina cetonica]VTR68054.1 2-oxoglutarate decarboxylase, thiamin-requiring [Desulfosarcina cetonica]